jgi:hypothetical protein
MQQGGPVAVCCNHDQDKPINHGVSRIAFKGADDPLAARHSTSAPELVEAQALSGAGNTPLSVAATANYIRPAHTGTVSPFSIVQTVVRHGQRCCARDQGGGQDHNF